MQSYCIKLNIWSFIHWFSEWKDFVASEKIIDREITCVALLFIYEHFYLLYINEIQLLCLTGLSVDSDSQGVERLFAHMWPGMILKSGDKITEPSLPENEGVFIRNLITFGLYLTCSPEC